MFDGTVTSVAKNVLTGGFSGIGGIVGIAVPEFVGIVLLYYLNYLDW